MFIRLQEKHSTLTSLKFHGNVFGENELSASPSKYEMFKENLCIVWAIDYWHIYLFGYKFVLIGVGFSFTKQI